MHRFFADKSAFSQNAATITGEDVAHITKVLRLKEKDSIILCDGEGTDYECSINTIDKTCITADIVNTYPNEAESGISITLYQGLPKSDKMDLIIQKCVELGVDAIVPVETARCVAKIKDDEKKRIRWQRIAEEAAKQCGRGIIPKVGNAISFDKAIAQKHDLKIMPYECERQANLSNTLAGADKNCTIAVYIGPEGGFEQAEADFAAKADVKTVTLGKRILRCETAGIATVSAIMYALGEWDI